MQASRRGVRRCLLAALAFTLASLPARAQEEVPFITTPDHVTLAMLELARVGPQDRLIDLGSGDGRIVITAARRFGTRGLGVEIVPDLVRRSREAAQAAGVADKATFAEQDLFQTALDGATVITMYLLPEVNLQLRPRLLALAPGTRIVSHDWDMGDWLPDQTRTLPVPDKAVGREKLSRVHLWTVPARVQGLWCGPRGQRLALVQQHQQLSAQLNAARPGPQDVFTLLGSVQGTQLLLHGPSGQLEARWQPDATLSVWRAGGRWQSWRGLRLHSRPGAGPCPRD